MNNNETPFVSVLVPSFNSGPYLAMAITSALGATIPIEIIVQDGGSTDGSLEGLPDDSRLVVIVEDDNGQADALNKALRRATGQYIAWLNADDLYYHGWAEALRVTAEANGQCEVIFGDFDAIDSEGRRLRKYTVSPWSWIRTYRRGCYIWSGATFFRRDMLQRLEFRADLHYCMDLDLFLRIPPNARVVAMGQRIAAFRWHSAGKTAVSPFAFVFEGMKVRYFYLKKNHRLAGAFLYATSLSLLGNLLTPLRQSRVWSRARRGKRL